MRLWSRLARLLVSRRSPHRATIICTLSAGVPCRCETVPTVLPSAIGYASMHPPVLHDARDGGSSLPTRLLSSLVLAVSTSCPPAPHGASRLSVSISTPSERLPQTSEGPDGNDDAQKGKTTMGCCGNPRHTRPPHATRGCTGSPSAT
jgi:hypothetical protein